MTTSNTTVSVSSTKSRNATKGNAKLLTSVVMSHREDKETASKAVNSLSKAVGAALHGLGTSDEKKAAITAAAETAKAAALASIDRQVSRAMQMSGISRGTTGNGGIHCSDVITEVFSGVGKSDAKANNTQALKSANLI